MTPAQPSKRLRAGFSAAAALAVCLAGTAVQAEEPAATTRELARSLADDGADAFARGDYERAHERLQEAFSQVEAPTIAVLDARALEKLGRLVEARAAYGRALVLPLNEASPAAFREAVASARVEARALERRLAWLTVRVRHVPLDARVQVWLDGAEVAPYTLGAPIAVDPEVHAVRLDVDGKHVESRRVSFREGESRAVELEPPSRGGASRTLAVVGFGVGGAGLVTGIVTGSLALSARKKAARECPAKRCTAGSPGAGALDDFRTYRTVSTLSYGVGVAGAALGTVLLLTGSGSRNAVEVGVAPALGGVNVGGTF